MKRFRNPHKSRSPSAFVQFLAGKKKLVNVMMRTLHASWFDLLSFCWIVCGRNEQNDCKFCMHILEYFRVTCLRLKQNRNTRKTWQISEITLSKNPDLLPRWGVIIFDSCEPLLMEIWSTISQKRWSNKLLRFEVRGAINIASIMCFSGSSHDVRFTSGDDILCFLLFIQNFRYSFSTIYMAFGAGHQ